ncbi:MAG: hypothetical protein ACTSXZ_05855 [Alphaproteobacteria bacterium]
MKSAHYFVLMAGLSFIFGSVFLGACDDAEDHDTADDDAVDDDTVPLADDDTTGDDDIGVDDDSTADDDTAGDDDTIADDDIVPDDYVAPWPQSNVETPDYNEDVTAGTVRQKAEAYQEWYNQHHRPFYGSTLEILFTDDSRTEVEKYECAWDSCFWTGMYLASQAFRYHVTGDPQAKANAVEAVEALDGHLHVTGKFGYVARYRGPQDPLVLPDDCAEVEHCHLVDEGPFAGDFWLGGTSRDQYHGLMMGMVIAYDLVDDETMRQMIRDDVTEILDYVIPNHWIIINLQAEPHATPNLVLPNMQLLWALIGYHVTGEERYRTVVGNLLLNEYRPLMASVGISWFSRYMEYYGNNLAHELFYNLLRLGKVYFSEDDYNFFKMLYEDQTNRWVALSHNPFFALVHMSQGDYAPEPGRDEYQEQLEQDLADFIDPPSYQRGVIPPPVELDPVSIWITDFFEEHPWLRDLLGAEVQYQALEAYPIMDQCPTHLFWEASPFLTYCEKPEMPRYVYPGFDFLFAYWMANYHKFIDKSM